MPFRGRFFQATARSKWSVILEVPVVEPDPADIGFKMLEGT